MRNTFLSCQLTFTRAALCAALFTTMPANAQDKPADFATQVPLTLSGEGPWYRIELPLAVQLGARQTGLGDVRVFNAEGQAQAYALTQGEAPHRENQTPIQVKWFALYNTVDTRDAVPKVRSSAPPAARWSKCSRWAKSKPAKRCCAAGCSTPARSRPRWNS